MLQVHLHAMSLENLLLTCSPHNPQIHTVMLAGVISVIWQIWSSWNALRFENPKHSFEGIIKNTKVVVQISNSVGNARLSLKDRGSPSFTTLHIQPQPAPSWRPIPIFLESSIFPLDQGKH